MFLKERLIRAYSYLKRRLLRITLVLIGVPLLGITLLFFSLHKYHYVTYEIADRIQKYFIIPIPIDLKASLYKLEKQKDKLEYWWFDYEEEILNSGLNAYHFLIPDSTINYFKIGEENPVYENVKNRYFPIKCVYKGDTLDVKFKLHAGDYVSSTIPHHMYKKKSYKIKAAKNEKLNERSQWEFFIPHDRFFLGTFFANQLDSKVGLPVTKCGFGTLKINGEFHGIYYIEEDIDEGQEYLIANNLEHCVYLKPIYNSVVRYDLDFHHTYPVAFKKNRYNFKQYENEIYSRLHELEKILEKNDQEQLSNYLDLDKIAAIEAEIFLRGNWGVHDIQEFGNSRWIYSTKTKKFFIVPRHETSFEQLSERYSPFNLSCIEKNLAHYNYYPGYQLLLHSTFLNRECRSKRIEYLSQLIYKNSIEREFVVLKDSIGSLFTKDVTSHVTWYETKELLNEIQQALGYNIEKIKSLYENSACYITINRNKNKLKVSVVPDSYTYLQFKKFEIQDQQSQNHKFDVRTIIKDELFALNLNSKLFPEKADYIFEFKLPIEKFELNDIKIEVMNMFTLRTLDKDKTLIHVIDSVDVITL